MNDIPYRAALIVGAGPGVGASLARRFSAAGLKVGVVAREAQRLGAVAAATGAEGFSADATDPASVEALFKAAEGKLGEIDVVVYNAGARIRGSLAELDPEAVRRAFDVNAFGGFLVAREAAKRFEKLGRGALFFTGATSSLKAYAISAPFAMGKFALRALAQSAARELGPKGVHVAHIVVDGVIRDAGRVDPADATLEPDAIADAYLDLLRQKRSAWSFEVELRPWCEKF
ncbi:SDR family oxidoreductase [Methylosinus sp. C49]|uniref:SDR family NAD(P)-dependent oxidoreductase n=1 Tax=Methylosinus sp. C49 TaxID=2699395 RepID=UPI0013679B05|nr:SDR family NAD(P)-dependent oxidoreductase [Methylosinus sp. C49]BBU63007.1 SDR family oxidoreductase [Methylosinus sp. C49]